MSTKEKILMFRCLFSLIIIAKIVIKHYCVDEYVLRQVYDRTDSLCKELSEHLTYLYSLKS